MHARTVTSLMMGVAAIVLVCGLLGCQEGSAGNRDGAGQPSRANGMADAQQDLEKGALRIKEPPVPGPAWYGDYIKLLRENGIELVVVSDFERRDMKDEMAGYNDVMLQEIRRRFGDDIRQKLLQQAEDNWRQQTTKKVSAANKRNEPSK